MSEPGLAVLDLGLATYAEVQRLQWRLRQEVAADRLQGVLLLLEHPPVITMGSRGNQREILLPDEAGLRGVALEDSERGGALTLHAPGQLVSYPIFRIPRRDLRAYVGALQETLRLMLAAMDVAAAPSPGRPGLYVGERKIASLGLRCAHWVASHGTACNLSTDLSLFELIVSCGEPGLMQTSVLELTGRSPSMDEAKLSYARSFAKVFQVACREPAAVGYEEVESFLGLQTKR